MDWWLLLVSKARLLHSGEFTWVLLVISIGSILVLSLEAYAPGSRAWILFTFSPSLGAIASTLTVAVDLKRLALPSFISILTLLGNLGCQTYSDRILRFGWKLLVIGTCRHIEVLLQLLQLLPQLHHIASPFSFSHALMIIIYVLPSLFLLTESFVHP